MKALIPHIKLGLQDKFDSRNIFSNTSIKNLTISNGTATHINVEKDGNLQKIAVKKVILAASSLNTPKILLNSGYKNKHLGQHLKLHPVSGVAGKFSEEQKPWAGTMQGIYSVSYTHLTLPTTYEV